MAPVPKDRRRAVNHRGHRRECLLDQADLRVEAECRACNLAHRERHPECRANRECPRDREE